MKTSEPHAADTGEPATILIVDDASDYLMLLGDLIAPQYKVRIATSGQRAIELAEVEPKPALILLDADMPGMDGFATLEQLQQLPGTRDIPVIFVTGMHDDIDEQRGFDLGAVDYIAKPPRPAILLARIRTQIELKRSRDVLKQNNSLLASEVAQRTRAEQEAQHLNDILLKRKHALEAAVKNLEAFSHTVSHDLRAPLRVINGYAKMLEETEAKSLSADGRALLERIIAGAQKLDKLIVDILEYTRVERAQRKDTLVDMTKLAAQITQELTAAHPNAEFAIGDLPQITADATMAKQILANLIGNACKFSGKRPDPKIEIGATIVAGVPEFYVRDNGVGFDASYAGKLFGMFQRLHSYQDFPGTGIGLSVVKRLVDHHHGRVSAQSVPGNQTTFRFTLAPDA
jgi:two-component system, sensor histidine kinase and response regulator